MRQPIRRRTFLRSSIAAAPLGAAAVARAASAAQFAAPEPETLTAYQDGPQVWVRSDNQPVASYRAHPTQKYPYIYPAAGPATGLSLTTETSLPWPHHRSMLFACDRVNGGNYWQNDPIHGRIVSRGPKLGRVTPESAEILDPCEWSKPGGPVVCRDERTITVALVDPRTRLIDWEIRWTAVEDLVVQKTNHSLFAIRAAADVTPLEGGELVDSEGRSGEKATFGKPAAWCGFFGKRAGGAGEVVEGIALFDHPKNPWSPCPWFTRDYGFLSPTPMNFLETDWRLPAGESVVMRYRVVLHAGDPAEAGLDQLWKTWSDS
jgi:hypothetical protein